VELVTAVALMGIVAAIALPSWMRLTPTYSLNNSVRQIQSELHSIKMRAAAEGVAFQMAYSQGAAVYTIKRNADGYDQANCGRNDDNKRRYDFFFAARHGWR